MWLYRCWRYIRIVQSAFDLLLFHMNSQGTRILQVAECHIAGSLVKALPGM